MDKWLDRPNVVRVVALILAILLWTMVRLDQTAPTAPPQQSQPQKQQRMINEVQVSVAGLDPEQVALISLEPEYVNIVVKGYREQINQVSPRDGQSRIFVDLSGLGAGTHQEVPLQSEGFPEGVEVEIYPSTVTVVMEEMQRREVPVQVELQGEVADGYRLGEPVARPGRVYVTLPESRLQQVAAVKVQVDVTGATSEIAAEGKLTAVDAEGNRLEGAVITPSVAQIEVPVTSPFTTVPLQIRVIGEPERGYSVAAFEQDTEEVTLYGAEEVLNQYAFYGGLEVNISGLNSSRTFNLQIPVQGNLRRVHPRQVQVRVEIVPSSTKTLNDIPLILNGQNREAETVIVDPENGNIPVVLEGAPERLQQVQAEDIQAIVDVSNLPPGTHEIPVQLHLPPFIRYAENAPLTVLVEIRQEESGDDQGTPPEPETETGAEPDNEPDTGSETGSETVPETGSENEQPSANPEQGGEENRSGPDSQAPDATDESSGSGSGGASGRESGAEESGSEEPGSRNVT